MLCPAYLLEAKDPLHLFEGYLGPRILAWHSSGSEKVACGSHLPLPLLLS